MNRLLIVTIILGLLSPGIYAQNYNPKFDEGPNLAEFLKAATEDSPLPCMPSPSIEETIRGVSLKDEGFPGLRKDLLKPRAGSFYPPLRPAVANNAIHDYAKKYPTQFETSQDPVAKELLIKWDDINSARGLLLDDAAGLESQDSGLYAERVQLAQNAAALNKEIEALKAAWAAHQQGCPVPHDAACTAEHNRLVEWDKDLRQRIAIHNANYDDWLKRKKALDDSVTGWRSKLKSWEQAILYFIEKAQAFLKDTGKCTPKQHDDLQREVDTLCSMKRGCEQSNPNDSAKDCPIWRLYYQRNIDCHNARREIDKVCYDGGNPIHQAEELKALEAAEHCWGFIQGNCLKVIPPSIPGRRYGGGF